MRLSPVSWLRRRRHHALERRVEQAVQAGVGLYRQVWELPAPPLAADDLRGITHDVLGWVEHTMGATRRPYGVDQLAVGLACAPAGGTGIVSVSFGVFRPREFYGEGGAQDRITAFVGDLPLPEINQHAPGVRIAAALFSWGDLARATVFRDRE